MCLTVKMSKRIGEKASKATIDRIGKKAGSIATKDITVYKYLTKTTQKGVYEAPFYGMKYKVGYEYWQDETEDKFTFDRSHSGNLYINRGLHAYASERELRDNVSIFGQSKHVLCEFMIPKGSTYYRGMGGDIVADRIVFVKIKKW